MDLRIDEKGKYYTAHIAKDAIHALVRTKDELITGCMHVRPNERLKDGLDSDPTRFLALTSARVFDLSGTELQYASSFLLVAYQHIITISPLDAIEPGTGKAWETTLLENGDVES